MHMINRILESIGLTKGEAKVYVQLLRIGNTSSGELIKKSGVSRSKVYEVLDRLKHKGLVTEIIKNNTKYFETTTPERVLDYIRIQKRDLESREKEAENIIPDLIKLQKERLEKQEAKVYYGIEGWKTLYSEILNNLTSKDEYLAFGTGPDEINDKRVALFFKNFHLKRAEKKVNARILLQPETKKIVKQKFSDLKFYKYKFLDVKVPTNIAIYQDNVITLVWGENPVAFLVHSKQVADKYKTYFKEMWNVAKQ